MIISKFVLTQKRTAAQMSHSKFYLSWEGKNITRKWPELKKRIMEQSVIKSIICKYFPIAAPFDISISKSLLIPNFLIQRIILCSLLHNFFSSKLNLPFCVHFSSQARVKSLTVTCGGALLQASWLPHRWAGIEAI